MPALPPRLLKYGKFFGRTAGEGAAFAIGAATAPALRPILQDLTNHTWTLHPVRPPDAGTLAAGVAQGQVDPDEAAEWAKQSGFGAEQFKALVDIANVGPGLAVAFDLARRGFITEDAFHRALKRQGLEAEWVQPITDLLRQLLSPAELANAVVQGHRSFDAAAADAEKQGIDRANFQTMVDNTGLPPGPETLQEWRRRGAISDEQLAQGIREGHTKVKYIPFYEATLKRVLSATEYAGLWIRGWLTEAQAKAGGALTGYDAAAMDLLYLNRGRPATPRQIRIGYARGAKIQDFAGSVTEAIKRATRQSDIRIEYEDIEVAASYTLPSPFVLRGLASSGAFTRQQVETILLQSGWLPEYAAAAAAFFSKATGATGAHETKAELADEYVTGFLSEDEYRSHLTTLGFTGQELDLEVLHAEVAAIKSARGAAVTKVRNMYEKGDITADHFRNALGKLGMHAVAVDREVAYANVVVDPSA